MALYGQTLLFNSSNFDIQISKQYTHYRTDDVKEAIGQEIERGNSQYPGMSRSASVPGNQHGRHRARIFQSAA